MHEHNNLGVSATIVVRTCGGLSQSLNIFFTKKTKRRGRDEQVLCRRYEV